jgi:hypothetical protein
VSVSVKADWLAKVYQQRRAVIDGRFVLDVLTREEMEHELARNAHGMWLRTPWWHVKGVEPAGAPYYLTDAPASCSVHPLIARRVQASGAGGRGRETWEDLGSPPATLV